MEKILSIFIFTIVLMACATSKLDFNTDVWKDPESYKYRAKDITERQKMLEAVLELVNGKSKNEIIDLLGHGEDFGYFKASGRDLIYILGPERSFISIDSEWLLLWFDQNNILERYEICSD